MTRSDLLALPLGARVSLKNGKIYEVVAPAYRFADHGGVRFSAEYMAANPDGFAPPTFQQFRTGEAKYPAGRLYGPSSYRLKPENVVGVVSTPGSPTLTVTPAATAEIAQLAAQLEAPRAAGMMADWPKAEGGMMADWNVAPAAQLEAPTVTVTPADASERARAANVVAVIEHRADPRAQVTTLTYADQTALADALRIAELAYRRAGSLTLAATAGRLADLIDATVAVDLLV